MEATGLLLRPKHDGQDIKKTPVDCLAINWRFWKYPRSESNRDRQNRNLKFYPLNYRGKRIANIQISGKPAKNN